MDQSAKGAQEEVDGGGVGVLPEPGQVVQSRSCSVLAQGSALGGYENRSNIVEVANGYLDRT